MKTGRLLLTSLIAASAVAGLGGCRSSQGTNQVVLRSGDATAENIVLDKKLSKLVRVDDVLVFDDRGDSMQTQVRVSNTTGRGQNVTYQWVWYEGDFELPEGANGARVLSLEPKETKTISGTAPDPRVDGFVLRLNRAN